MPRPRKMPILLDAPVLDLTLVEEPEERDTMLASRDRCIQAQHWQDNRAFKAAFRRRKEIAWDSMDAFTKAQEEYRAKIQLNRRGEQGRVGERKTNAYSRSAAFRGLRPLLYGLMAFVMFFYAMSNGFWVKQDENVVQIWMTPAEREQLAKNNAAPIEVYPEEEYEHTPAVWLNPVVEHRRAQARQWFYGALGGLAFHIIRRYIFRPKPKEIVIPDVIKLDMLPE